MSITEIASQVQIDVLSKDHTLENAAKTKEVARTFICKSMKLGKVTLPKESF